MLAYAMRLKSNALFYGLRDEDHALLLESESCILGRYKKHTVIVEEGDACHSIGLILEGALYVEQLSPSGEMIKIQMFFEGECFGPALMFESEPYYPYALVTATNTSVLYIPFDSVNALLKTSLQFNRNCLTYLSDRVRMFQDKVRVLSQKDVRSRLILFLSRQACETKQLSFDVRYSKTELADLLGVARPSLSRELKRMREDGLLEWKENRVTLRQPGVFRL